MNDSECHYDPFPRQIYKNYSSLGTYAEHNTDQLHFMDTSENYDDTQNGRNHDFQIW